MARDLDFKDNPTTDFEDVEDLDEEQARREVEALREGIDEHDRLYYRENRPKISDEVYDRLFRRLQELEQAFPELDSPSSPTRRVGAEPADELPRVEHTETMLSLDAVLDQGEVGRFLDRLERAVGEAVRLVCEPKLDGLSVEVVYEDGLLVRGATRGDGRGGEEVTANIRTVRTLPLRLHGSPPPRLAVRGEVMLPRQAFQQVNKARIEAGEVAFANPRNAAAGTLRRLESREVARHPLVFVAYDVLRSEDEALKTHWEELERLEAWGFLIVEMARRCFTIEEIARQHQRLDKGRDELDYEVDGLVLKVDDLELRPRLGRRQRSPRWALAWKFEPRKEVTRLEEIVVQVGRTGQLTPVALLRPVDVDGVTVSRASLHNKDELERKDVRPGDLVRIHRAGDVIPEVVERVEASNQERGPAFEWPDRCPACDAELIREGAHLFCPAGLSCPPQLQGRLVHYGSREALDIEGLGEETARDLVEQGLVGDLTDLYRLEVAELVDLPGFADRKAEKLHQAIEASKAPRLDRFVYALGIPHVGRALARTLAEQLGSFRALREADEATLKAIPEVGRAIAASVVTFFEDPGTREVLDGLVEAGVEPQALPGDDEAPLAGRTFVFTGSLERTTRQEAEELVERLGGRATSSVSGQTDYLVVGEGAGSKLDEARQREVEIIDEARFRELTRR